MISIYHSGYGYGNENARQPQSNQSQNCPPQTGWAHISLTLKTGWTHLSLTYQ